MKTKRTHQIETPAIILEKRKRYAEENKELLRKRSSESYSRKRNRISSASRKRKRILSITLYDGSMYAKFTTKQAEIRYKLQIECDSLWNKFCSLESLISVEAFKTIERINQIEYLTI